MTRHRFRLEKNAGLNVWKLTSDCVEATLTEKGGHLGPVHFQLGRRRISPLAIAPWRTEKSNLEMEPVLRILGGDFFCLPFGGNSTAFGTERHPAHGETANRTWKLLGHDNNQSAEWSLCTTVRSGEVIKKIWLVPGQTAVYQRHEIHGMQGPMNLGHHANIQFPAIENGGYISTNPFSFGQVYPGVLEEPSQGGYSSLRPGARFTSLAKVPLAVGGYANLSRYPARRGFNDLILLASRPTDEFAWTAVSFPQERYVWIGLKDPRVLRQTIMWMSNGGRHYPPWNSRHISVLGLEEVTSYFHEGLAEAASPNPLNRLGIPTCIELQPDHPTEINYIMAVAETPTGFDKVIRVRRTGSGIVLVSKSGKQIQMPLSMDFLQGASPCG